MAPAPPRSRLAERELARFGPLTVTRASMTPLRIALGVVLLVNAVLLGCIVAMWSRLRRLETELADASREDQPKR
jgi:hypothetical protein